MTWDEAPVLYSEWIYDMLKNGYGSIHCHQCIQDLGEKLNTYTGVQTKIHEIVGAWEFVSKVEAGDPGDSTICSWFCYWLGDLIQKNEKNAEFSTVLSAVCVALKGLSIVTNCNPLDHHNTWDKFKQYKGEFELNQDYNPNNAQLQKYYKSCDSTYHGMRKAFPSNFADVKEKCGSNWENPTESYCTKFKEQYTQYCRKVPSELTCTIPKKPSAGDDFDFRDAKVDLEHMLSDSILNTLPSTIAYNKFNTAKETCTGDESLPEEIGSLLNADEGAKRYIPRLRNVWCYAQKGGEEGELSDNERCGFLYYWIGYMFDDIINDDESFWSFMDKVLGNLKTLSNGGECKIVRSPFSRHNFYYERRVYDYYIDHTSIGTKLGETDESSCSETLKQYLSDAAQAYYQVNRECKNGAATSAYCTKFKGEYKNLIRKELLKSKCKPAQIQGFLHDAEDPVSAAAPIVSSVLGVLGLPTIVFFLYKYNLLPSWFSNKFGSNTSRKRRTAPERNFDELTADTSTIDGSAAFDSTDTSTHYSTDGSTIYGGQPRRGTRTGTSNNRRQPQQKQRQQQRQKGQRQQRNIGYQNM